MQAQVVEQKLHYVLANILECPVRRVTAVVYSYWLQLAIAPECAGSQPQHATLVSCRPLRKDHDWSVALRPFS